MSAPTPTLRAAPAPRGVVWADFLALAAALGAAVYFGRQTQLAAFQGLSLLLAWAAWTAFVLALPAWRWGLRPILSLIAASLAVAGPVRWYFLNPTTPTGIATTADETLRLAAVALAVLVFALHFLASYTASTRREHEDEALAALTPLLRIVGWALAVVVALLLVRLYAQRDWLSQGGHAFALAAAGLVAEAALRALARWYQPPRLRQPWIAGRSVLLSALFGEAGPLRSLAATLPSVFGVQLGETWLVQLARRFAAPLALLGLLAVWLSSGVTRVPVAHRGVLQGGGGPDLSALAPGLHLHAPWPWGQVTLIATERIRELSIGFERDLDGPILWTEKHFEGEQNLLVGQGEELLTINVPIHYRVRDAVAFFRRTQDAETALDALGYRELLALASSHTSFGLMTTDREEISEALRARLQSVCDQLGLGLEIVFVGLKDVHPPVGVASAYQDVVSAEEQQITLVDQARTYAAETAASGAIAAQQIRQEAASAAARRLLLARGETSRFLAPLATFQAHPELARIRLRLEAVEEALAGVRQIYLVPPGSQPRTVLLPGPAAPAFVPPAQPPTAAAPSATR